jgi:hypothetical protein
MFFANIFSYTHRARLCETAYRNTRQRLLAQRATLAPLLARHGIRLDLAKLEEADRPIRAALTDPRPLFIDTPTVKTAAHALARTLDALEAWLHRDPTAHSSRRQPRTAAA